MVTLPTYTDTESPAVEVNRMALQRAILAAYAADHSLVRFPR